MLRSVAILALALQTSAPATFDSNRAWEHLRRLVAIGPRPAGSPAIENTRKYIKEQLAASGLTTVDQAWDDRTPLGTVHMVNLIATIPGASKNRLVIAGHYDTKKFREFPFVGANDGGSSAAFLIELARVLKNRTNALTIEGWVRPVVHTSLLTQQIFFRGDSRNCLDPYYLSLEPVGSPATMVEHLFSSFRDSRSGMPGDPGRAGQPSSAVRRANRRSPGPRTTREPLGGPRRRD